MKTSWAPPTMPIAARIRVFLPIECPPAARTSATADGGEPQGQHDEADEPGGPQRCPAERDDAAEAEADHPAERVLGLAAAAHARPEAHAARAEARPSSRARAGTACVAQLLLEHIHYGRASRRISGTLADQGLGDRVHQP